jgi:hypothetical protein
MERKPKPANMACIAVDNNASGIVYYAERHRYGERERMATDGGAFSI